MDAATEEKVQRLLGECRESGDRAYTVFKSILERLEDPEKRGDARKLLASVERYADEQLRNVDCLATFHFRIHQLLLYDMEGFGRSRQKLTLLELPSIFIPEDWSFTFFEGINRLPETGFHDRDVAELGCGNGWVSIAIAEKWSPKKVYGLDINPRAIKVAWINLYMNALNPDGSLVIDREGKSLLDRVEFHVSDLLAHCRERSILLDRVVGCIPQVLSPDPEAMIKLVSENASEEFLYSLSNYCGLQGFVEDQFGLGLIARAAEEGIDVIKPSGAMIFNIGGRPGQAVCERLFRRRGFTISKLWQTRVKQAADTDILALVEIEKSSRHRFEFFMGLLSEEPVSARTAWAYAKAGGEISHGLSVYQCKLRHPHEIKTIFKFLSDKSQEIRGALDLSFDDDSVAEEKIPFLAYLARALEAGSYLPHNSLSVGTTNFANLVSSFFRIYHGIPLTPLNVLVQPSRSVLIENILRVYQPRLALINANFTRWLPKKWLTVLPDEAYFCDKQQAVSEAEQTIAVIEAPHRADLVIQLLRRLKPQIVVTSLADFEMRTSTAFKQLLDECAEVGSRLFLDISEHVELCSAPHTNGVLQYLAAQPLPEHAAILCGLVKNKVYSDLEVAFLLSENATVLRGLSLAGDMVNGGTAAISQFYYGCLLHELLSFHLPDRHSTSLRAPRAEEGASKLIGFAARASSAMAEAEFPSCAGEAIRMDAEEISLPMPAEVKAVIFEAFARQNISDAERDPRPELLQYVRSKLGQKQAELQLELTLGHSCLSLFSGLVSACVEQGGTLCFPTGGCSGTYVSAAKLLGASVSHIPTSSSNGFKLSPADVLSALPAVARPWLYVSAPVVTPTGMLHSCEEVNAILRACEQAAPGARVILDTSFSALQTLSSTPTSSWEWELPRGRGMEVVLLGSLGAQLLTGGVEVAFVAYRAVASPVFGEALRDAATPKPHYTSNYVMKKLLQQQQRQQSEQQQEQQQQQGEQQQLLRERVTCLQKVLCECGWEVLEPSAGQSLVARPLTSQYGEEVNRGRLREMLLEEGGVCINSSSWTGLPDRYCRFVALQDEDKMRAALLALTRFKERHAVNK